MLWTVLDSCLLRQTHFPSRTWSTEHNSQTSNFCARVQTTTGTLKFCWEKWKVQYKSALCARDLRVLLSMPLSHIALHQSLRSVTWHLRSLRFSWGFIIVCTLWFVLQSASWTREQAKGRPWGEQIINWCLRIQTKAAIMVTPPIQVPHRHNLHALKSTWGHCVPAS